MSRGSDVVASQVRAIAAQTSVDSGHSCTACTTVSSWLAPLARHLAHRAWSPFRLTAPSKCPWCMVTHRWWRSCSGRAQCVSAPAISPRRPSLCVWERPANMWA
eukprot:scaffold34841_cov65-Phaeocystis_antarctica.AAC.1